MSIRQEQHITNDPTTSAQQNRCYTVDDLMEILGVGRKAIYTLIRKKAFPAIRISSVGYRIPKESFNTWMLNSNT